MVAKKSTEPVVFDVSKPKRGAPPLNVKKRAVLKEEQPSVAETSEEAVPVTVTRPKKVVIKPIHESLGGEEIVAVAKDAPDEKPETPENAESEVTETATTKPADEPKSAPKATAPEQPAGFPEPVADPAVKPEEQPGVPAEKAEREAEDEIARKRTARLQKMIEEEEYFLPIQTVEERRSRRVAIFGVLLIIILAAAWYDAALDANLLPNTYNLPHTSFFTVK